MKIADVHEAFGILSERRRLKAIQAAPNHELTFVGFFHDPEVVAAVLPSYAAEVARRIAVMEDRLNELGVDLSEDIQLLKLDVNGFVTGHAQPTPSAEG